MATKNISAFSVREIVNQNTIIPFRTTQIGASGFCSGVGTTFDFHASGFYNRALAKQIMIVGNGPGPINYDISFFMTSSMTSSERQYYYQTINLRAIDLPAQSIPLFDNDDSNCLHGRITNQYSASVFLNYIDIKYNRMLEIS